MCRFSRSLALALTLATVACATAPTAEPDVLAAVEEIRVALAGDDADVVWELLSTRHRNLYEEARRTRAGLMDPALADSLPLVEFDDIGAEVPRADAARMTAREFHRAQYVPAADLVPVGDDAQVRFENDWASVNDVATQRRWLLRDEQGDWKLEMRLHPDFFSAGFRVHTCPSGREIVLAAVLSRKKVHEVPLPVVQGDTELGYPGLELRLAVERDGRVEMKGEFLDDSVLKERLRAFADRQRDLFSTPQQYSTVQVWLAVHHEQTWRRVDEVLWLLADADVRIRNVAFLTSEFPAGHRGVPVVLGARARPLQVKFAAADLEVRVGSAAATPERLADLEKALAARPAADFENGIRTIVSPDLPVGEALSALIVVGRRGEVFHVLAKEPFTGLLLDRKPVEPTGIAAPTPDPSTIRLTLVLRLPPGAPTPTDLFRRLRVALDHDDREEMEGLLAPSVRTSPETESGSPWRKAKGATLKEVTVDGDRATVSFDGPHCLGVLHLVREEGAWYMVPDPKGSTPESR